MKLLVLHALQRASRKTTIDHVLAFGRHLSEAEVIFHHLREPGLEEVLRQPFDLVILSHCLLSHRTTDFWDEHLRRLSPLRDRPGKLVAMPQDDYKHSHNLDRAMTQLAVDHIFSPIEEGLERLYPLSSPGIPISTVLTGYIEPSDLPSEASVPLRGRSLDLGTRVRNLPAQYGAYGQRKGKQAIAVDLAARERGFHVDISTNPRDTLIGDDWSAFLSSCRFTLGSRGGASLVDRDGNIQKRVERYSSKNPDAEYEQIREICFPDETEFNFTAISPRLFESAMAGTCQILTPDDYLGLKPHVHYLPLEDDLSNLDDVLTAMADLETAQGIADAAFEALIQNPDNTYPAFVRHVVNASGASSSTEARQIAVTHSTSSDRLEAARLILGEPLFEAFRVLLLQAHRRGEIQLLEKVFSALQRLQDERPALVRELHRQHLCDLVQASLAPGHQALSATVDVARHCILAGGGDVCDSWFHAASEGDLDEHGLWPWTSARLVGFDAKAN